MSIKKALVVCSRVNHPQDNPTLKPGAQQRNCVHCGARVWVSPTTLALQAKVDLTITCPPCGNSLAIAESIANNAAIELVIAPGALRDPTPSDRRRRNELEAHGFRDIRPDELG